MSSVRPLAISTRTFLLDRSASPARPDAIAEPRGPGTCTPDAIDQSPRSSGGIRRSSLGWRTSRVPWPCQRVAHSGNRTRQGRVQEDTERWLHDHCHRPESLPSSTEQTARYLRHPRSTAQGRVVSRQQQLDAAGVVGLRPPEYSQGMPSVTREIDGLHRARPDRVGQVSTASPVASWPCAGPWTRWHADRLPAPLCRPGALPWRAPALGPSPRS